MKMNIGMSVLLTSLSAMASAQKVDLDKFSFPVSYQELPKVYVPLESRTFNVVANVAPSYRDATNSSDIINNINIIGWNWSDKEAVVQVAANFSEFGIKGSNAETRTVEEKDKAGKVVKTTRYYSVKTVYNAQATATINGPEEAREPKKKNNTENKFLSGGSTTNAAGYATDRINYSTTLNFQTPESLNAVESSKNYQINKDNYYAQQSKSYVGSTMSSLNRTLNNKYGYPEERKNDILWILDSKSHPEFENQQQAIQAIKVLFAQMSATASIDDLKTGLEPVVEYFNTLKTKYTSSDKADKKMRYSAFYNLAKIYYYLDMPEKCIEEAEGLIKNDYDTGDGKHLIKMAEKLKEEMARANTDTRHNAHLK